MIHHFTDKQGELIRSALQMEQGADGIYRNKYTSILYGGGVGGGKTWGGLGLLILLCLIFPGSKWLIVRTTIPSLRRTSLEAFKQIYPQDRLKQKPTASNMWTAIFDNNSQIQFFPELYDQDKDFDRWKSLEANGFFLEEGNEMQYGAFLKAIERKGRWRLSEPWEMNGKLVQPSIVLITCNPSRNWVYDQFYLPWKEGRLNPRYKYIPALWSDNPYYPADKVEEARATFDPLTFKRFMEGDWDIVMNSNPWAYAFNRAKHVEAGDWRESLIENRTVFLSCDQNVEPPAAAVWQYGKGFARQLVESDLPEGSPHSVAAWFKSLNIGNDVAIIGDATGRRRQQATKGNMSWYQVLANELGVPYSRIMANKSNIPVTASRTLVNGILANHPKIRINAGCTRTISDLEQAKVDKSGLLIKSRRDDSEFLDYLDQFRYALEWFFPDWLKFPQKYV